MNQIYTCQVLNHTNEQIIGHCLNPNCKDVSAFCFTCVRTLHRNHQEDCKSFQQIMSLISEKIHILEGKKNIIDQLTYKLKQIYQQSLKQINSESASLIELHRTIEQQEFYKLKNSIDHLKQWYKSTNNIGIIFTQQGQMLNNLDNYIEKLKVITVSKMNEEKPLNNQKQSLFKNKIKIVEQKVESKIEPQLSIEEYMMIGIYLSKPLAKSLVTDNLFQEAIQYYDIVLKIDPTYKNAQLEKGEILCKQNHIEEAINCFNLAINSDIANQQNYENIVGIKYLIEDTLKKCHLLNDAVNIYDTLLHQNPEQPELQYLKGLILIQNKDYYGAIYTFDKAFSQDSMIKSLICLKKGDALMVLGMEDEAQRCYSLAETDLNY